MIEDASRGMGWGVMGDGGWEMGNGGWEMDFLRSAAHSHSDLPPPTATVEMEMEMDMFCLTAACWLHDKSICIYSAVRPA